MYSLREETVAQSPPFPVPLFKDGMMRRVLLVLHAELRVNDSYARLWALGRLFSSLMSELGMLRRVVLSSVSGNKPEMRDSLRDSLEKDTGGERRIQNPFANQEESDKRRRI